MNYFHLWPEINTPFEIEQTPEDMLLNECLDLLHLAVESSLDYSKRFGPYDVQFRTEQITWHYIPAGYILRVTIFCEYPDLAEQLVEYLISHGVPKESINVHYEGSKL